MPPLVSESINYNLRSSHSYTTSLSRLTLYQKSLFPATLNLWNDLDINIRNSLSVHIFKRKLKLKYVRIPQPPTYHFTGNWRPNKLHEDSICSCGVGPETAEHYFLYCTKYVTARNKLKNNKEINKYTFCIKCITLWRWRRKSWN